jgi:hypothetical protein
MTAVYEFLAIAGLFATVYGLRLLYLGWSGQ